MFSRGGFSAGAGRCRRSETNAIDMLVAGARGNPDKTFVTTYIGQLVVAGYAELQMLDNGEFEIRFASGETYLLAETAILRLA